MEAEKKLSPLESLELIADTITRTKENIRENSYCFLLWGWLIAGASFAYFVLQQLAITRYYFLPFPVLALAGMVLTVRWFRQRERQATLGYTAYFINKMWMVLGLCFILVVFINVAQGKMPFTYTLIIAGMGTLVSGLVMKFQPLVLGGLLFLASAMASIYIPGAYIPLLHGLAVVAGYLVPGYLLKNTKA